MVYSYKPGAQIKTSPQVAGEVCEFLEKSGELTPKRLLDASRPADAPLHSEFEWDDAKAAEGYRESQAAHIIRCITVEVEAISEQPRAFHSIAIDGEKTYKSLSAIIERPDYYQQMLSNAERDFKTYCAKYAALKALGQAMQDFELSLKAARQQS